jgi:4-hydroxy 2-oxovalerate aldolase
VYFNNPRRYDYFENSGQLTGLKKILTSNVESNDANSIIVPIEKIMKGNTDNSTIMLLNLLDLLEVGEIALAGFDGFADKLNNYASSELERHHSENAKETAKIRKMFGDFLMHKTVQTVRFITPSLYEDSIG